MAIKQQLKKKEKVVKMSEEKLYTVMDDEGLLLLYSEQGAPLWRLWGEMFAEKSDAERAANAENGHVVTLIKEPKKVVLTKEQAEIVEDAHDNEIPATFISRHPVDEELLMKAYVNGYTVAKEKKYNVKVPHTRFYYWKWKADEPGIDALTSDDKKDERYRFTESDIEHYNLQDCEKEEVTEDEQ